LQANEIFFDGGTEESSSQIKYNKKERLLVRYPGHGKLRDTLVVKE
jgi:hypothetical protein